MKERTDCRSWTSWTPKNSMQTRSMCTEPKGHDGPHHNRYTGAKWPREDRALTRPSERTREDENHG